LPTQEDFLTVAEHELGHLLGFGTAPSWENRVVGSSFLGLAAQAEHAGAIPTDAPNPNAGHWQDSTMDNGTRCTMDPTLPAGVRATFTQLDFAGLADLGWQVAGLGVPVNQPPITQDAALADITNDQTLSIPVSTLLAVDQPGPPSESGQSLSIVSVYNAVGGTVALVGSTILFQPTANYVGPASFTYTVSDNGTTNGQSDPKVAQASVFFNIDAPPAPANPTPVTPKRNDVPVVSTPQQIVVRRNAPISFTGTNRIAVADRDVGTGMLRLTFTALHGTLRMHSSRGLVAAGNNTIHLTLTGTLSRLNQALASLQFMPMRNYVGAARVTMTVTDIDHPGSTHATIVIKVRR
jgi:hypothetical protein